MSPPSPQIDAQGGGPIILVSPYLKVEGYAPISPGLTPMGTLFNIITFLLTYLALVIN